PGYAAHSPVPTLLVPFLAPQQLTASLFSALGGFSSGLLSNVRVLTYASIVVVVVAHFIYKIESHRRRLSTLIFSSSQQSQLDGSFSPISRGGGAPGEAGAESPSSSPTQNRTLKPPTPTNNTNRNSFGLWGGSKS